MQNQEMKLDPGDRWLSPKEVSEILGVGVSYPYVLIKRGLLSSVGIPVTGPNPKRQIRRIRQSDLDKFLSNHYTPGRKG